MSVRPSLSRASQAEKARATRSWPRSFRFVAPMTAFSPSPDRGAPARSHGRWRRLTRPRRPPLSRPSTRAPSWWPRAVPWCSGSQMRIDRPDTVRHCCPGSPASSLGHDIEAAAGDARVRCGRRSRWIPRRSITSSSWAAAGLWGSRTGGLKLREIAGAWSEAYPAMEYRHGPIRRRAAQRDMAVGQMPEDVLAEVEKTGATVVRNGLDPMAELVLAQRVAVAAAQLRGLNPDRPRHLARSVVLSSSGSETRARACVAPRAGERLREKV